MSPKRVKYYRMNHNVKCAIVVAALCDAIVAAVLCKQAQAFVQMHNLRRNAMNTAVLGFS